MLTLTVHTGAHVAYARIVVSMAMSAFGEVMRTRRTAMRTFDMAIRPRRMAMRPRRTGMCPRRTAMRPRRTGMRPRRTAMRECGISEWSIRNACSPNRT